MTNEPTVAMVQQETEEETIAPDLSTWEGSLVAMGRLLRKRKWKIQLISEIRCEAGLCPILALGDTLGKVPQLVRKRLDLGLPANSWYRQVADELKMDPATAKRIAYAADEIDMRDRALLWLALNGWPKTAFLDRGGERGMEKVRSQ